MGYTVVNKKIYRNLLEREQRHALLRVASAFCTISTMALQVITGITPIGLLVQERSHMHQFGGIEARKVAKMDAS